ncbi:hypothetical protein, variant 3 [Aphanomyces astaci]|nr:hypothetical protein, variant 3 [Aphanomyces astaci]ETV79932.1 hypothetical protein, variant 3 [Aphanomyces astaci]|eukprot:XP_009830868.1 hypothetical protein, variant 3 [Aphanomyces astaci]
MMKNRILLTDPEALKHVLTTHSDIYPRDDGTRMIFRDLIGGDGLLSSENATHAQQRRMMQPLFRHDNIKSFLGMFHHHVRRLQDEHLARLQLSPPSTPPANTTQTVDMHELFTKLTLDIIGVSAFSYEFDALAPHQDKYPQTKQVSVVEAIELLITPPSLLYIVGILLLPWFPRWPLPAQNQRRRARRRLFEVVDAVLASKLSPSAKPPPSATSLPKTIKMLDLVDLMLTDTNDHKVSIDEARIHVMTFMLAGHETTSTTLSWVFTMLAQHADVEAKVRAECRHVLAANNHSWDWKALGELKYTTAVIHETLRLFPTASMLATRVCVQDNDMPTLASVNEHAKPVFIPKGTQMLVHTGAMHRNPKYWSRPAEFVPDRFIEGTESFEADKGLRGGQGNTYYYMPFSTGSKNCIGMRFAMAELQVVVASLVARHSFRLTPDANVEPSFVGVTMRPKHLNMTVHLVD